MAWRGKGLHLNEIDPRAEALAALFPQATVTSFDAARIASHVPIAERHRDEPTFARSASGHADSDAAARHLLSALATLRPGGRLVAIMPDGFSNHGRTREPSRVFCKAVMSACTCVWRGLHQTWHIDPDPPARG
jgi:uncharacterized protein (DUF1501 family)